MKLIHRNTKNWRRGHIESRRLSSLFVAATLLLSLLPLAPTTAIAASAVPDNLLISHYTGNTNPAAGVSQNPQINEAGQVVYQSQAVLQNASSSGTGTDNIYLWDPATNTNRLISHYTGSSDPGTRASTQPQINEAGQVLYQSLASLQNVSGSGTTNIYLWDSATDTNALLSHYTGNTNPGTGTSQNAQINEAGYVVYQSTSALQGASGTNPSLANNIYLWDPATNTNMLVSHYTGNADPGTGLSQYPQLNEANQVVYSSASTLHVASGTTAPGTNQNIYFWNPTADTNTLISHYTGNSNPGTGNAGLPQLNEAGQVAYYSYSALQNTSGTNPGQNIYLWNPATNTNTLVSHYMGNTSPGASTSYGPQINEAGQVVYQSYSTLQNASGTGSANNIYLWNPATNINTLVSHYAGNTDPGTGGSTNPQINEAGQVVYQSNCTLQSTSGWGSSANIYLWDPATNTNMLISHYTGNANYGTGASYYPQLNEARQVTYQSQSALQGASGTGATVFNVYLWAPDTTPPDTTIDITDGSVITTDTVHVTITDNLDPDPLIHYELDGGTETTGTGTVDVSNLTEGEHTITYWGEDEAGNIDGPYTITFIVDTTTPTTTINPADGTLAQAATVTFSVNETATTYYSINGQTPQTYTAGHTLPEGMHTISYQSVDSAGNSETTKTATIKVDKTAPVTTAVKAGGLYNNAVALVLSKTDPSSNGVSSGVDKTYYRINGGAVTPYTTTVYFTSDGTYSVEYWSVDKVGNAETHKTVTYTLDLTAPNITVDGTNEGQTHPQDPHITITVDDTEADHTYTLDGKPWKPGDPIGDGHHTLVVTATDKAGNKSTKTVHFNVKAPIPLPGTGDYTIWTVSIATLLLALAGTALVLKRKTAK